MLFTPRADALKRSSIDKPTTNIADRIRIDPVDSYLSMMEKFDREIALLSSQGKRNVSP